MQGETRLRVREGSVHWLTADGESTVKAGTEVVFSKGAKAAERPVGTSGQEWDWTAKTTPDFEIDNRPLGDFLEWVARESGRKLVLADDETREQAARVRMHGSVHRLTPMQALSAVMATTELRYDYRMGRSSKLREWNDPARVVGTALAFFLSPRVSPRQPRPPGGAARSISLLQELKSAGIDVIYNSTIVPPDLRASMDDLPSDPLRAASAALAAHGLELRQIAPRHYVVVRVAVAPASAAPTREPILAEVSVYASRFAIDGRSLAEPTVLSGPEINLVPGTHDDALRALKALPGLASNVSARPYIRGSLSQDVLFRYDGMTLLDPYHLKNFQSLVSAIDPAAIDGIEVFSSGFPVQYGTRSGGVISMTAPTVPAGYENRIGASAISAGASTLGRADRLPLEWFGAIRRTRSTCSSPSRTASASRSSATRSVACAGKPRRAPGRPDGCCSTMSSTWASRMTRRLRTRAIVTSTCGSRAIIASELH